MAVVSPMMQQYLEIKNEYSDSVVFFRLGDFYEMFYDDAEKISKELDLTLTGRDCGTEERAPMCGVPYHSCESYIGRLVAKGYKVAVCEQMEDPATAKGLVRREVTRVITPGTIIENELLDESKNNYLAAAVSMNDSIGVCFVDASTGMLNLTQLDGDDLTNRLLNEIAAFSPSELLVSFDIGRDPYFSDFMNTRLNCRWQEVGGSAYGFDACCDIVLKHFSVDSLNELELGKTPAAICALGCAIKYLYETQRTGLDSVNSINFYTESLFMRLDINARRNLELTETMRNRDKRGSLLWVLDKTGTAMGKRLMNSWIVQPLMNVAEIDKRLNATEELFDNTVLRGELRQRLSKIHDIERIITKVVYGSANPRDLKSLAYAVKNLPEIKELVSSCHSSMLKTIYEEIDTLTDMHDLIESAIKDNPPVSQKDGGIIKKGFNSDFDLINSDFKDGSNIITSLEAKERERTGIPKLRVGYNRVFGYYIEVSNSYKDKVPDNYIRKQTLTNGERYITEELKALEQRVLGAKEAALKMEYEIFDALRKQVAGEMTRFKVTAAAIARLDVFCSLAEVAVTNDYCRPNILSDGRMHIDQGRHPVVEAVLKAPFVPNDTDMDLGDSRCAIITGPNMAGKSTYMRQVALISIMAQIGSFVPAKFADIGIVDAVFTRVGASDDLTAGQSTFMVEMSEVATILKNATSKSLLILDEIGRGTSTYDGMSIARAVLEYTADKKLLGAKTLFATHYHELTALEGEIDGVKNYNIAVKKRGDDITFLRRIIRGAADDSYGIEVAKLAGIPDKIIKRAKHVLSDIENSDTLPEERTVSVKESDDMQIGFAGAGNEVVDRLKNLDVDTLTPIEAMSKLYELTELAKKY